MMTMQELKEQAGVIIEQAFGAGEANARAQMPEVEAPVSEDGTAAPAPVSDKVYSETEAQQMVTDATSSLRAQLQDAQAQIAGEQDRIAAAVAQVKGELLARYQEMEVAEQERETGFVNMLK